LAVTIVFNAPHWQLKFLVPKSNRKDGSKYEGQWERGFRHGQGTRQFSNGHRYSGSWRNGDIEGVGTYIWEVSVIQQDRKKKKKCDSGTLLITSGRTAIMSLRKSQEGTVYDGEWAANQCHGKGRKIWASGLAAGNIFSGDWARGTMHGQGVYIWQDGRFADFYCFFYCLKLRNLDAWCIVPTQPI
jgi:hypothetical protein